MSMKAPVLALRIFHGLASVYFLACLMYLYYAAFARHYDPLLLVALVSLAAEGFVVFVFNRGDCPLIHIQRKVGDDKPFFELLMPKRLAKIALPVFAVLTLLGVVLLLGLPYVAPLAG
jgi:hypothetical protein